MAIAAEHGTHTHTTSKVRKVLRKEIILYIALLKTGIIIYKRKEWIQGTEKDRKLSGSKRPPPRHSVCEKVNISYLP